jgi:5'-nucleotidase
MAKPHILLSNDDGINAPGLAALEKEISKFATVSIVAPITEMSAMGHAITISNPIKLVNIYRDEEFYGYGIEGTPSDCVKLAIQGDLISKPDMVISGINQGANLGIDIIYSGTVSAAYEGTLLGVPSIAVSLDSFKSKDFSIAAKIVSHLAKKVLAQGLPLGTLLNLNIPAVKSIDQIKGIKIVKQGNALYRENFEKRMDPRNRVYYWMSGERDVKDLNPELDEIAIKDNWVTLTPIQYNLTHFDFMKNLSSWGLDMESLDA